MACYIFLRYNKDNYAKELTEKSDLNETYFEVQEPAWTDGFSNILCPAVCKRSV